MRLQSLHVRCRGLTLPELILALASTAIIGAAIDSMLAAVSYGTSSEKDLRTLVVKHKVVDGRLSAAIRSSHMVLDQGANFVVLWTSDLDGNGVPNLLELRRIEHDTANEELWSYQASSPPTDTQYQLTDNFGTITAGLKGQTWFPGTLWATNITNWTVTLNHVDPQQATLASYRITLSTGTMSDTTINAAALRN